jgi:hypothetical protein
VTDYAADLNPGTSVGYFISYESGGHWRLRWTCDSALSGYYCLFDGTVQSTSGDSLSNLAAVSLDGSDDAWFTDETATAIGFSATATVAADGFDFDSTPGAKVTFDVLIDGVVYARLVFLPSGDPDGGAAFAASPAALPVTLLPTVP